MPFAPSLSQWDARSIPDKDKMSAQAANVLENMNIVLDGLSKQTKLNNELLTDELFEKLCQDFQADILKQATNADGLYLTYRLSYPFDQLFSKSSMRRLLDKTFGWSAHWKYNDRERTISISAAAAKEYMGFTMDKFKSRYDIGRFDTYETILRKLDEDVNTQREGDIIELEAVQKRDFAELIKIFADRCIIKNPGYSFNHTRVTGQAMYLSFWYYFTMVTRGAQMPSLEIDRFVTYFDEFANAEEITVRTTVSNGERYYEGIIIKLPDQKPFPRRAYKKGNLEKTMTMINLRQTTRKKLKTKH